MILEVLVYDSRKFNLFHFLAPGLLGETLVQPNTHTHMRTADPPRATVII